MSKNIYDEKVKERKQIHEELLQKQMKNIENRIRDEKYNVDTMLSKTGITGVYHDLVDSKDKLNSERQRTFNKAYHSVDVELYKLNKKIDNRMKMVNYKFNEKKDQIYNKVLYEML